jgi:hypothetical protein
MILLMKYTERLPLKFWAKIFRVVFKVNYLKSKKIIPKQVQNQVEKFQEKSRIYLYKIT